MEWFLAVVVVAILGVAAVAAAGGMGEMADRPVYDTFAQDLPPERPLRAADVAGLRFGMTMRGYAMQQVDDVLDRLAREIAERDATIEALSGPGAARSDADQSGHPSAPRFPTEPQPREILDFDQPGGHR
jgi:DivIVA domain-containing protein